MNSYLMNCLNGLKLLEPQVHKNMTVIPLTHSKGSRFKYLTLSEALAANSIKVTEVDQGGSVPELCVINSA